MPEPSVVLEFVNRIFLEYSPQYSQIKKIAERDVGQELLDKVKKFLDDKKKDSQTIKIPEKVILEDASTVNEEDINDIVDAFVKMRSDSVFSEIDNKSINEILILFNQWMMIGKSQSQGTSPVDQRSHITTLEEQISAIGAPFKQESELYPSVLPRNIYNVRPAQDIYSTASSIQDLSANPFYHVSEYKMQRQTNL